MRDRGGGNLEAALREAEAEALKNNFLGVDLDLDQEEGDVQNASVEIAERARRNKDLLSAAVDFRELHLKPGHESRPLWVAPTGHIYLETSSKYFALATDFLVAISEPESRPELIHHYKLTPYSLYAAVSVNLDTETILRTLERFSKLPVPEQVVAFVHNCTKSHGKAKLVLKRNRLFVESRYPEVLKELLKVPAIRESQDNSLLAQLQRRKGEAARGHDVGGGGGGAGAAAAANAAGAGAGAGAVGSAAFRESSAAVEDKAALATNFEELDLLDELEKRVANVDEIGDEDEDEEAATGQQAQSTSLQVSSVRNGGTKLTIKRGRTQEPSEKAAPPRPEKVVSFEVRSDCYEQVKEAAMKADYPLMEEYDFRKDDRNPDLPINLRASTKVRPYQEKSLAKMFGNGRARSGIIVLPCGAGKTLTGITAACTVKKSCIIFCINSVGVEQWIRSLRMFTTLPEDHIRRFTSNSKDDLHPSGATVLVTTYNMMSYSRGRSEDGERVMEQVKNTEWGLIVMDEVHVVPAKMFRMALRHVKSHCKLGLTATLVREDNLIDDLNFLIGPKLYEANWLKLTDQGYLAKVQCAEVWCPMTAEFFEKYLDPETTNKEKQLLYVMNPNKYATCKMLMDYHRKMNDKVLIFSDNIPAIKRYSQYLGVTNMYGSTSQYERELVLAQFRGSEGMKEINVLIISQVGDVGIDLPQANVIIQISSHFGSRRQEAQRLGRILRPKSGENFNVGYNAFFYSLISMDTAEMYFSHKRQKYLVDQGYTFKVIRNIKAAALEAGIQYDEMDRETQLKVLQDLQAEEVTKLMEENNERKLAAAAARRAAAVPDKRIKNSAIRKFLKKHRG